MASYGRRDELCSRRLDVRASSKEEEWGRGEKHPGVRMDKGDAWKARFTGGRDVCRSLADDDSRRYGRRGDTVTHGRSTVTFNEF